MGIIKKVIEFILDKDNQRFLFFAGLVLALIFSFTQCEKKKEALAEVAKQENNILALSDSVRYYKDETGEVTARKLALEMDVEQLEDTNSELLTELRKEKDEVSFLSTVNAQLRDSLGRVDTTSVMEIEEGEWRFDWSLTKSGERWSSQYSGFTEFTIDTTGTPYNPNTVLSEHSIDMEITTGVTTNERGQKEIFVRTTYPNLTFTDINGVLLEDSPLREEERRRRWSLGPYIGYGMNTNGEFHPSVGLSLNYNLFQW